MVLICGVDEAGRGPVIGPIVFAGVALDEKDVHILEEWGVTDSKMLSSRRREELFEKIKEIAKDYCILSLNPQAIDAAVNSQHSNLNDLGSDASARIIMHLLPQRAILDCPSVNISAYKRQMQKKVGASMELVVEHKADVNHTIVGAASILAKVTRDRAILRIAERVGKDIGSGYPSDPTTKAFLAENYDKFDFFRRSWATYKTIVSKNGQRDLGSF